MQTRNYSPRSIDTYMHMLNALEEYHDTSIDEISIDQVKDEIDKLKSFGYNLFE